jgi:signal transduction histidine kinase
MSKQVMSLRFVWTWLVLGTLWLVTACSPVDEGPPLSLIQSREWRIDPSGRETLADAEKAINWQAMSEYKSWGFGAETIWIRLRLRAAETDTSPPWAVRLRPAYLDYVSLYDPVSALALHSGDAIASGGDDMSSIVFMFNIPALRQERTIYLQIRSSSARLVHAEVLPSAQARHKNRVQEWLVGFIGSTSAIFAFLAFGQWWFNRDKVVFAFAVKQVLATSYVFFLFGFARLVVGPGLQEGVLSTIASTVLIWTICSIFWFFSLLIQDYEPNHFPYRIYRLIIGLMFFLPVLFNFIPDHWVIAATNVTLLVLLSLLILTVAMAFFNNRKNPPLPITTLLVYLLIYSVPLYIPLMMNLGFMEVQPIAFYATLANTVLDGIVMFILLQLRARTVRIQQAKIADDLRRSQLEGDERKRHQKELSQLFSMLAHEIKTPLSTLRMWMEVGPLNPSLIERTISDMNLVVERCVQAGQLSEQGLQPVPENVDPADLSHQSIERCRFPERVDWTLIVPGGDLHTDPQMLTIVLANLLDNACKYSTPDSRIVVTLERFVHQHLRGWRWQVTNHVGASGFPDVDKLFEKYYRSLGARRVSGSGLGLFLVKELIRLLQGHIHFEQHGEQVVFGFWLPERLDSEQAAR